MRSSQTLVIASIVGLAVGLPQIFLTTFSAFLTPLIAEFGWSRSEASGLFSVVTICIALSSPLFAYLSQKYGVSRVLTSSIILLSLCIALMALTTSGYLSFLVWAAVIGMVGTGTTTFVYLGVFPSWFTARLGIALGIAAMGIGLGQMIFPIVAQHFISNVGWRDAYQLLALISLMIGLPGALFVIRYKNRAGAAPLSAGTTENAHQSPNRKNSAVGSHRDIKPTQFRQYLAEPKLWYLSVAFLIVPMIAAGCTVHAMLIFIAKGVEAESAARIFALGGFSIMVARVAAGFLLDWVGAPTVAIIACIAATAAPLVMGSWSPTSTLILAPLLYGLALGIEGDLMPYGIRNAFGVESVPILYGPLFGVFNVGVVIGPLLMGITYDQTGSYDAALIILSLSAIVAIPLFLKGLTAPVAENT